MTLLIMLLSFIFLFGALEAMFLNLGISYAIVFSIASCVTAFLTIILVVIELNNKETN